MAFIDLMYMWEMKKGPKLAPSLTVGSEIPKANGCYFLCAIIKFGSSSSGAKVN